MKIFYTNKKDIALSWVVALWIITTAILIVIHMRWLYDLDITWLKIDEATGFSREILNRNYGVLIDYLSPFYRGELHLPDFIMSASGSHHFKEVKDIVNIVYGLWTISGIGSFVILWSYWKKRIYTFLKTCVVSTLLLPTIVGFVASLDFNMAFILFHRIIFNNDDWMFDPRYDPVINILPEAFFMHALIMIIIVIIVLCVICWMTCVIRQRRENISC